MTELQKQIHEIYTGLQSRLGNSDACHFLCLCSIIHEYRGRPVDILGLASHALAEGWLREDYYVRDALAILYYATKKRWSVYKTTENPGNARDSQYTELEWYNSRTGYTHFTRRYVDTLQNSVTVAEGKVKSYRIYSVSQ